MSKRKEKMVDILEDEKTVDNIETVESKEEEKCENRLEAENKVLKEENDRLVNENSSLNTKYLMALAETQNYKKRMDEEHSKFIKYSTFNLCKEIVKTLDNLDLALDKEYDEQMESYLSGFRMVRNSLFSILEKEGVKEIETLGKDFDPNYMTSISVTNDESKKDNEVSLVYQKGYMYKDRVLRPAMVAVNQVDSKEKDENKE